LLNQRLGTNMVAVTGLTWPEVMEGAKTGELDMIMCIANTPERRPFFNFTHPYLNLPIVVFMQEDAPFLAGVSALEGLRVAVVNEYAPHEYSCATNSLS
jgi:ABC-type amino acid transport substrate-binding protein